VDVAVADRAPVLEQDAELEARLGFADERALVDAKQMVEGPRCRMVDSPTPIVPISSDSTRTMSSTVPSSRPSAAATTQPAVPPPAMTTRLIAGPSATFFLPVID
jgi:hypothetical protein